MTAGLERACLEAAGLVVTVGSFGNSWASLVTAGLETAGLVTFGRFGGSRFGGSWRVWRQLTSLVTARMFWFWCSILKCEVIPPLGPLKPVPTVTHILLSRVGPAPIYAAFFPGTALCTNHSQETPLPKNSTSSLLSFKTSFRVNRDFFYPHLNNLCSQGWLPAGSIAPYRPSIYNLSALASQVLGFKEI